MISSLFSTVSEWIPFRGVLNFEEQTLFAILLYFFAFFSAITPPFERAMRVFVSPSTRKPTRVFLP
jgi:hypothetical protein